VSASSSEAIGVRVAGHDDIDGVLAVWEEARSAAAMTPDDADAVARLIDHTPDALLVAECDGEVVGVLVAAWDGWRGNMYRLAVLPAHRGRGIGRRLVEAGHERLRAKGARRVTALVARGEEEAVGLWRATGYRLDEQMARFVRDL
jgi:ribosomal protein S18 acetylase RimI-like enzyme